MSIWLLLGHFAVSALFGLLFAGACVVIGGVGGLSALARRINLAEQRVEDVDARITKEVKTRAALAAVEKRKEATSAKDQAEEYMRQNQQPATGRPKVANLLR